MEMLYACVCVTQSHAFFENADISRSIATRHPYKQWLKSSLRKLSDLGESTFLQVCVHMRPQTRMRRRLSPRGSVGPAQCQTTSKGTMRA